MEEWEVAVEFESRNLVPRDFPRTERVQVFSSVTIYSNVVSHFPFLIYNITELTMIYIW